MLNAHTAVYADVAYEHQVSSGGFRVRPSTAACDTISDEPVSALRRWHSKLQLGQYLD